MSHHYQDQLSNLHLLFALVYESMEILFPIKLKVLLVVLLFQVLPAAAEMPSPNSPCQLSSNSDTKYFRDGEFMVGGIFHVKELSKPLNLHFDYKPHHDKCSKSLFKRYRYLLVFIYTIGEINKDPEILPNVTLGYHIFDSCDDAQRSLEGTFSILSGTQQLIPNYSCWKNKKVVGFIGDLSSDSSLNMASLIGIYRYPQISYGSRDLIFNDRVQFPSFYRTIPDDLSEIYGIVELIKHFGWRWVGLIVSDDETGYKAGTNLEKEMKKNGICLAFFISIDDGLMASTNGNSVRETLLSSTANVIVLLASLLSVEFILFFFAVFEMPEKLWIVSSTFLGVLNTAYPQNRITFNGMLALSIQQGEIPGFMEYLYGLNPSLCFSEVVFTNISERLSDCDLSDANQIIPSRTGISLPKCTESELFGQYGTSPFNDTMNFRISYGVYTAVYTMALALHKLYMKQKRTNHADRHASLQRNFKQWQLNDIIQNKVFEKTSEHKIHFKLKGDPSTQYDILKCFFSENNYQTLKVGSFDTSKPAGKQLYINTSVDLWGPYFTEYFYFAPQCPQSECNEPCMPGYRRSKIEGKPLCCYKCVACAEGEISNTTDAQSCIRCLQDEKSNKERNGCIPKNINFLSCEDVLGATLSSISVICTVTCTIILAMFIKYRETPIVRANNRNLSCILLISLMLCFLCTLLFIGRPTQICCLLRQVTFGIVFTISVSSVLAKTLTVIIAFNATKPGSKLKKYVGTQLSIILVIACSLGEIMISIVWMATNPSFTEADFLSDPNYIILQCNEGSGSFFFCIIGYMGTLALLSFIAAFLAKDFPDRFNEAKNITFSMLVFCSVWVTFVPAYLSSKGSRMVAVEIFAILFSSAGLLGCIFIPKCYIILLRPELNAKDNLVRKQYYECVHFRVLILCDPCVITSRRGTEFEN
ncbi:vomeronasal type-2 receptor 26-like [Xenopus laevis]|uniref:Vomeronasal type-2 receptor 26-like n=1 Tax=Xenopus laevis TaxID=8355 RepID=A0A8J1KR06_XENLA|nr:vomeronasal type-2 receptor 26-like [Xenopus laevis]